MGSIIHALSDDKILEKWEVWLNYYHLLILWF
jgi:hypothetical protein